MPSWLPFVGVCGGLLRAVVGHLWVGVWALLVACEALLLLWAPHLVADVACMPWSLLAAVAIGS